MTSRISAIIPAAGYSSRMGALKPILKLGDRTVLERVIGLFRGSGVKDVIVVVGHGASQTISIAHKCGAQAVTNKHFDRGMFSSVQEGVKALSPDSSAFFMLPVDIPLVRPQTVRELIEAYHRGTGNIVFPAFLGKRGHPPLVDARYRDEILSHSGEGGLRAILRNHEGQSIQIEVADEMILTDLDTPGDYAAITAKLSRYGAPTPRELKVLLRHKFVSRRDPIEHSLAVAKLALRLASALNRRGARLDMELILAAAMLHDVAKGMTNHAVAGAEMISRMGFSAISQVVASHTDITIEEQDPLDEREVIYLADKLVQGCVVTPLQARFEEATQRRCDNPEGRQAMLDRLEKAKMIKRRCEAILGLSLQSILTRRMDESEEAEIQSLLAEAW